MSAAANVMQLTSAEVSRIDRFREAEHLVVAERLITSDEMIETCLAERDRIEASVRAAEAAFGTPFDARKVRTCATLQRTAEFLGLLEQRKDEIRAVLKAAPAPKRRRA